MKVLTDQDGLYGIGSANDLYNPEAVVQVIEQLLAPQLIGRETGNIEDIWQTMQLSSYWRNGSILQTAIGGIDVALWDIKGKEAGLPIYQLLGGACRAAVPCYGHAGGHDIAELKEDVHRFREQGYTVIRAQLGGYGGGGFIPSGQANVPENAWAKEAVFDEHAYLQAIPAMFEQLRLEFGSAVQFTHDVHEHVSPIGAIRLSKRLEPYDLFFLEDALPPEHAGWYRQLRQQSATPQAVGELFPANPQEWTPLIAERLIDFIRVRVSKVGGISAARKIATLAEAFGVRTAWQEGGKNIRSTKRRPCIWTWRYGISASRRSITSSRKSAKRSRDSSSGAADTCTSPASRASASTSTRRRRCCCRETTGSARAITSRTSWTARRTEPW